MKQSQGLVTCKFCKQKLSQMQMYAHTLECNLSNHPEYVSNIQSQINDNQSKVQQQAQIKINVPKPSQVEPMTKSSNIRQNSRFIPPQQNNNNNQQQQQSVIISEINNPSYRNNKQEVPLQQEPKQSQINDYTESLIQNTVQKCDYCQEDFPKDSIQEHLNVCESLKSLQQYQDDAYNEQPFDQDNQSSFTNRQTEILQQDGTIKQISVQVNPITGETIQKITIVHPRTGPISVQTTRISQPGTHHNPYNRPEFPPMPQPPQSNIYPQPPPQVNFQDIPSPFQFPGFISRPRFPINPPNLFRSNSLFERFFKDLLGDHRYEEIQDHLTIIKYTPYDSLSDEHKQCNICFSEYQDGEELILLPCLHRFHKECIKKWFEEQLTCPICKLDIRRELIPFEGEVDEDDI